MRGKWAERGLIGPGSWVELGLSWAGLAGFLVLGLGWVLFSFSILFLKQTNMFEFKYKFEFKPHSLN